MNKQDLIDQISEKTGFSKPKSEKSIDAILEEITLALKKGDTVKIEEFGIFFLAGSKLEIEYQDEADNKQSKKKVKFLADEEFLGN